MSEILKAWETTQEFLKNRLGQTVFETWILPLKLKPRGKDAFILEAPDDFFRDWVEKHYRQIIQEGISQSGNGQAITLHIQAASSDSSQPNVIAAQRTAPKPQEHTGLTSLNSRYTFENFVIGPSNRHAHAYSLAVAASPAKAYNPLFIYGGVGLGKTHLIQAICHYIRGGQGVT